MKATESPICWCAFWSRERKSTHYFFVDLVLDTDIYIQSKLFFLTSILKSMAEIISLILSTLAMFLVCLVCFVLFFFSICRLEIGCREKVKGKVEKDSSKRKCFVDGLLFIWKKYNVWMCQSELSSLQPTKVIWPIEGQWPKSDWIVLDRWALSINWASISNALAGFLHSNTHIHYPTMTRAKTNTNTWQQQGINK